MTKTCAERVARARDNRLDEIRIRLGDVREDDCRIEGDKLICDDIAIEFDTDSYDGTPDIEDVFADHEDEIREAAYDAWGDYGLATDYVAPETFDDQEEGYFRFQISYGGPSEEIRFYVNPDFSVHCIEFWLLDWFDGASRDVTKDPRAMALADFYINTETFQYLYQQYENAA